MSIILPFMTSVSPFLLFSAFHFCLVSFSVSLILPLRVWGEFPQLHSDELVLGQRLSGHQQRLPQQPEHGQGGAEDAALFPWCLHWHLGEKRQS